MWRPQEQVARSALNFAESLAARCYPASETYDDGGDGEVIQWVFSDSLVDCVFHSAWVRLGLAPELVHCQECVQGPRVLVVELLDSRKRAGEWKP